MKRLIIPALALLFSVCKVQAQTTASTHPVKHEKKTVMHQPKKGANSSTAVTVQKTTPVAKGKTQPTLRSSAATNRTQVTKSTTTQVNRPASASVTKTKTMTSKPKHTYAAAHKKHARPTNKNSKEQSK